jgi:WD40 repeat protein
LTSWKDSSLILWNLTKGSDHLVYQTTPHAASIIDVEANTSLRLIATLGKARNCMLLMLDSRSLVRYFVVDGTDSLQKILLFSHGFIAILSAVKPSTSKKSVIRLYGLDARKPRNDHVLPDGVSTWCKLNLIVVFNVSQLRSHPLGCCSGEFRTYPL